MKKLLKIFIVICFLFNNNNFVIKSVAKANDVYSPFNNFGEDNSKVIEFKDLNLKQGILEYYKFHIDKNYSGKELTENMMSKFSSLKLSWKNIFSLEGLEFAKNLKNLDLSNNFIEDIAPLEKLVFLEDLNLSNNKIKDAKVISNLKNLTKLSIRKNLISKIDFLNNLQVEELDLSKNGILKKEIATNLNVIKLRVLNISSIGLDNIDFLRNFVNLEDLYLEENNVRDISSLQYLTKLKFLNISKNSVENLEPLKNVSNLEQFIAIKNNIKNIDAIGNKKYLYRIMLDDNVELENIDILKTVSNLESLSINNTKVSSLRSLYDLKYIFYVSLIDSKVDSNEQSSFIISNENYKKFLGIDKKVEVVVNNVNKYFSLKNYIFMLLIFLLTLSGVYSYWRRNV